MKSYILILLTICFHFVNARAQAKFDWLVNAKSYYNGGVLIGQDLVSGSDESIVVVGYFQRNADFDPGPDTFNLTAKGEQDIYVAKYSKKGELLFAYNFGSKKNEIFDFSYHIHAYQGAYAVTLDDEDNIYVTGIFNDKIDFNTGAGTAYLSADESTDIFILSLTKTGAFRFAKDIAHTSGPGLVQTSKSIAVDKQKNIYITGSYRGENIDFDPSSSQALLSSNGHATDIFFAKYDSSGHYIFAKSIGGTYDDAGNKIAIDKKGNIVVCGEFKRSTVDFDPGPDTARLFTHGKEDIFFAKYDSLGNYIYAKGIGGVGHDMAESMQIDNDNSIIITGEFNRRVDFDPGPEFHELRSFGDDVFLAKYGPGGNYQFAFHIQGYCSARDVAVDSMNNIFITGAISGRAADFDPGKNVYIADSIHYEYNYIAKYSPLGGFIFGGAISNYDHLDYLKNSSINALYVNIKGDLIIGGDFSDSLDLDPGPKMKNIYEPAITMFTAKYSNAGDYINAFSGDNYFNYYSSGTVITDSKIDHEGNVYITGLFNGRYDFYPGKGVFVLESLLNYTHVIFFAKYDISGQLIFAKALLGGESYSTALAVDENENIYLTGITHFSTDFDPSDHVKYIDNNKVDPHIQAYFFAKYNRLGNLVFVKGEEIHGNFDDITIDKNKNIYISGSIGGVVDFDPGPGKATVDPRKSAIFFAKYDSSGNYMLVDTITSRNTETTGRINIMLNTKNDIVLGGLFRGTDVDFDPGTGTYLLSTNCQSCSPGFIASYEESGAFKFAFPLAAADNNYNAYINSLATDASDNIFIGGRYYGFIDFDGDTGSVKLPNQRGIYFAAYNATGALRFVKGFTSYQLNGADDEISDISVDSKRNIFVAGQFNSYKVDCDPGADSAFLINTSYERGGNALFFGKFDSLGNYMYAYAFNTKEIQDFNYSSAINVDKHGNIFYAGYVRDAVDFDPGADTNYVRHTSEDADLFLVKYSDVQNDLPVNKLFAENLIRTPDKNFSINRNKKLNVGHKR